MLIYCMNQTFQVLGVVCVVFVHARLVQVVYNERSIHRPALRSRKKDKPSCVVCASVPVVVIGNKPEMDHKSSGAYLPTKNRKQSRAILQVLVRATVVGWTSPHPVSDAHPPPGSGSSGTKIAFCRFPTYLHRFFKSFRTMSGT